MDNIPLNKPVIAVDIDEVLSPLHEPFLMHHNQVYDTEYVYPDAEGRYYLNQFTGEDLETSTIKIKEFVDHPSFPEVILPLPGAVDAIATLGKKYRLVVVTARQHFYKDRTSVFLDQYFPGLFSGVHFIPDSLDAALSPAQAKLEICSEEKAEFLIDDNVGTCRVAAEEGMQAVLFGSYHWNQADELPSGVVRCKDWAAVLEYFDGK